jgi:hypothetical protein
MEQESGKCINRDVRIVAECGLISNYLGGVMIAEKSTFQKWLMC